jgi:ribose transport system substrate-binding protein
VALLALVMVGCVDAPRDADTMDPRSNVAASTNARASISPPSTEALASPGVPTIPSASSPLATVAPTRPPSSVEPSIGYISLDESLPFVRAVSGGIREAAASAGITVHACDPGWSTEGVRGCAAQLAQTGVHGVVSFQPFPELAAEVCDVVGGVPVVGVVFDQGPCQVSRLDIEQGASGRLAGEAVGAFAAEHWDCVVNAWVSLESGDADPDGRARMQGYRDGFTDHCPLPEKSFTLDGADRLATAQTQVGDLLPEMRGKHNIVVGLNEDAILGAMAAVGAAGREGDVWYSGQLAAPSIRGHIACDEHYIASVAQFPERFGGPVVGALIDAIEGRAVAPRIEAELSLVTSTNVRALFPDTPSCDE